VSEQKINYWLKVISAFGYPALFFGLILEFLGLPFPGEIVLAFAGFLVWNGHLDFGTAVFSAAGGSLAGTVMAYWLGRKLGRPFLKLYGKYAFINAHKINRAERWFNRHSFIVLLLGRFVSGVRPLSAYMAGIARMKFWVFLPLSFFGTFVWCITFILLGNYLGQNWARILAVVGKYNLVAVILLAATLLAFYFKRRSIVNRKRPK